MNKELYPEVKVFPPRQNMPVFTLHCGEQVNARAEVRREVDAHRLALCWNALRRVSDADLQRAQGDGIAWVTKREAEAVEKLDDILGLLQALRDVDLPAHLAEKRDEILLLQ